MILQFGVCGFKFGVYVTEKRNNFFTQHAMLETETFIQRNHHNLKVRFFYDHWQH